MFIKDVSKLIKKEAEEQKGGFIKIPGWGVIRAGE